MYLARISQKTKGYRYVIRQSYDDGVCYRSRDLFDLGDDPSRFIIYPGGNGFYIDMVVEETIAKKGIWVSQEDLEPVFLPFLDPYIRRVINGFDRKSRYQKRASDTCVPAESYHIFDRYRLHYLKQGQVNVRDLGCTPDKFYSMLQDKSRDEIEYDFIAAERILKPHELSRYTFQIFDLKRYFTGKTRNHPEVLDRNDMDHVFIKALCELNRDEVFWLGSSEEAGLRQHLVRYAIMYFDSNFPSDNPIRDYVRDFMNRHRIYQPPKSVQMSLAESARLFSVSVDTLKKMNCQMLTRKYRKLAKQHHPDKGGDQETFVKLSSAYHKLLKRKSRL
jgi:hypothetical protein